MGIVSIDGHMLRKMIIAGANKLAENKEYIDSLNVFPVPDGDTGTNMSLTVLAAAKEVEALNTDDVSVVAKAASSGSLRGARGNSGVILSQLFRGFAKGLENCKTANVDNIAAAFEKSSEIAYKAVMKPKEGTILTVAREIAEKAFEVSFDTDDIEILATKSLKYGEEVLKKTKEMLPALKQADVVDAGGYGLLVFLTGAFESINSNVVFSTLKSDSSKTFFSPLSSASNEDILFGYCTEFFINVKSVDERLENELKSYLATLGDSIVVVGDDDIVKIHVHTNNPGSVLEKALSYGHLSNLKIENMRLQHTEAISFISANPTPAPFASLHESPNTSYVNSDKVLPKTEKKPVGFVCVSIGKGFVEVFKELGVDSIIEGGQTMNPCAEDIATAANSINSDNIIVLPNNKNIVLAAQQASYLCPDKTLHIIGSNSIPQGIAAMISYVPGSEIEDIVANMEESLESVKTCQITHAVRDTVIKDKEIKEGNFLCILNGEIEAVSQSLELATKSLADVSIDKQTSLVSVYYGEETPEEKAQEFIEYIEEKYPDVETELIYGGQPIYYYIFSVE